jgi:hypothetical protein
VVLEVDDGGDWVEVTTHAGRPVDSTFADFLMAHTPYPLKPPEDPQTHTYWVGWQPVGHMHDRAGLPLGEYRLHVYGLRATGGTSWPFETEAYEVTSDPFEVLPATIDFEISGSDLYLWLQAYERGFRLVGLNGSSTGENPVPDHEVTLSWTLDDGSSYEETLTGALSGSRTLLSGAIPDGATGLVVTDIYGNTGELRF